MPKQITNEDLAKMIADGFAGVDDRFEQIETRSDSGEAELKGIKTRLSSIENQIENLNQNQKEMDKSIKNNTANKVILKDHEKRLRKLEKVKLVTIGLK